MSKLSMFASASVLSVIVAGSIVTPAYAWHPKGIITKSVQNVTTNGSVQAADSATSAVSAKPGDILNYVVTVSNTAAPAQKQYNDLAFTKVTDTLPAGVELVSNPATRTLTTDMGLILPGKSQTVTYKVKVTSPTNGAVVTNTACFTADSVVKDNPQKGCDNAVLKVTVPPTPEVKPPVVTPVTTTPTPTAPTPVQPAAPVVVAQPEALPSVGIGSNVMLIALAASVMGYVAFARNLKRKNSSVNVA